MFVPAAFPLVDIDKKDDGTAQHITPQHIYLYIVVSLTSPQCIAIYTRNMIKRDELKVVWEVGCCSFQDKF